MNTNKTRVVLIPAKYNILCLNDIENIIINLKSIVQVVVICDKYVDYKIVDGVYYVNPNSDLTKYFIYTSEFIIDSGESYYLSKVYSKQKRISVWHGIPYKKLFTEYSPKFYNAALNYSSKFDIMISSSDYYTQKFLKETLHYKGEILEIGSPRFDCAFNININNAQKLNKLINPQNKKVILYAPTYRDVNSKLPSDIYEFSEKVNDQYMVIYRGHHYSKFLLKGKNIIDLSEYKNLNEILEITDILITDYSSILFDFALYEKRIVLLHYDYEEYMINRGLMFDISKYIDSSFIMDSFDKVFNILDSIPLNNFSLLKNKFLPYENGNSSKLLIESLCIKNELRVIPEIIFNVQPYSEDVFYLQNFIELINKLKREYNSRIIILSEDYTDKYEDLADIIISKENNYKEYNFFIENVSIPIVNIGIEVHNKVSSKIGNRLVIILDTESKLNKSNINNFSLVFKNNLDMEVEVEYVKKLSINSIVNEFSSYLNLTNDKELLINEHYIISTQIDNKIEELSKPLVSVIIPYFNNQSTIENSLKSVIEQSYSNIEIILINDGSKLIFTNYMKSLSNLIYFSKKNEGLGLTRNFGVNKSNGEYIFFLDADDTLFDDSIEKLIMYSIDKNLEVTSGRTIRANVNTNNNSIWREELYKETKVLTKEFLYKLQPDTLSTNKLYKKSFLLDNSIKFEDGLFEDKLFINKVYSKLEKIGIVSENVYKWIIYGMNTSITTTINFNNFNERFKRISEIWSLLDEKTKIHNLYLVISHDFRIYIDNYNNFSESEKSLMYNMMSSFIKLNKDYYSKFIENNSFSISLYKILVEEDFYAFDIHARMLTILYNKNHKNIFEEYKFNLDGSIMSKYTFIYHRKGVVKKRVQSIYSNNVIRTFTHKYSIDGKLLSRGNLEIENSKLISNQEINFSNGKRLFTKQIKNTKNGKIEENFTYYLNGKVKSKDIKYYNKKNMLFKRIINNYYGE